MKVSSKILAKTLPLLIIISLAVGIGCLSSDKAYNKYHYKYYSDNNVIDELISEDFGDFRINKHNSKYPGTTYIDLNNHEYAIKYLKDLIKEGYDFNNNGEIEDEEFYQGQYNHYISCSKNHYQTYKIETIGIIILYVVSISIFLINLIYFIRINKLIKIIKKYRAYMLSTNKFTIKDIAEEFGESIETVEANIQKAIDKHILKNVYLSKQTKEILLIDNVSANKKVKGNIQNVNVENNVIISEKGENNN